MELTREMLEPLLHFYSDEILQDDIDKQLSLMDELILSLETPVLMRSYPLLYELLDQIQRWLFLRLPSLSKKPVGGRVNRPTSGKIANMNSSTLAYGSKLTAEASVPGFGAPLEFPELSVSIKTFSSEDFLRFYPRIVALVQSLARRPPLMISSREFNDFSNIFSKFWAGVASLFFSDLIDVFAHFPAIARGGYMPALEAAAAFAEIVRWKQADFLEGRTVSAAYACRAFAAHARDLGAHLGPIPVVVLTGLARIVDNMRSIADAPARVEPDGVARNAVRMSETAKVGRTLGKLGQTERDKLRRQKTQSMGGSPAGARAPKSRLRVGSSQMLAVEASRTGSLSKMRNAVLEPVADAAPQPPPPVTNVSSLMMQNGLVIPRGKLPPSPPVPRSRPSAGRRVPVAPLPPIVQRTDSLQPNPLSGWAAAAAALMDFLGALFVLPEPVPTLAGILLVNDVACVDPILPFFAAPPCDPTFVNTLRVISGTLRAFNSLPYEHPPAPCSASLLARNISDALAVVLPNPLLPGSRQARNALLHLILDICRNFTAGAVALTDTKICGFLNTLLLPLVSGFSVPNTGSEPSSAGATARGRVPTNWLSAKLEDYIAFRLGVACLSELLDREETKAAADRVCRDFSDPLYSSLVNSLAGAPPDEPGPASCASESATASRFASDVATATGLAPARWTHTQRARVVNENKTTRQSDIQPRSESAWSDTAASSVYSKSPQAAAPGQPRFRVAGSYPELYWPVEYALTLIPAASSLFVRLLSRKIGSLHAVSTLCSTLSGALRGQMHVSQLSAARLLLRSFPPFTRPNSAHLETELRGLWTRRLRGGNWPMSTHILSKRADDHSASTPGPQRRIDRDAATALEATTMVSFDAAESVTKSVPVQPLVQAGATEPSPGLGLAPRSVALGSNTHEGQATSIAFLQPVDVPPFQAFSLIPDLIECGLRLENAPDVRKEALMAAHALAERAGGLDWTLFDQDSNTSWAHSRTSTAARGIFEKLPPPLLASMGERAYPNLVDLTAIVCSDDPVLTSAALSLLWCLLLPPPLSQVWSLLRLFSSASADTPWLEDSVEPINDQPILAVNAWRSAFKNDWAALLDLWKISDDVMRGIPPEDTDSSPFPIRRGLPLALLALPCGLVGALLSGLETIEEKSEHFTPITSTLSLQVSFLADLVFASKHVALAVRRYHAQQWSSANVRSAMPADPVGDASSRFGSRGFVKAPQPSGHFVAHLVCRAFLEQLELMEFTPFDERGLLLDADGKVAPKQPKLLLAPSGNISSVGCAQNLELKLRALLAVVCPELFGRGFGLLLEDDADESESEETDDGPILAFSLRLPQKKPRPDTTESGADARPAVPEAIRLRRERLLRSLPPREQLAALYLARAPTFHALRIRQEHLSCLGEKIVHVDRSFFLAAQEAARAALGATQAEQARLLKAGAESARDAEEAFYRDIIGREQMLKRTDIVPTGIMPLGSGGKPVEVSKWRAEPK
eukprot:gnl/Chilomastix_cuspidata/2505.p1 GENE.gnl/Chilomastix_cuspidata/2505~~gnl/Chilomastix_cuspidata/2505.p1  ORF type:complete len:1489 (+),score=598.96 gnl/Chilomastix_cuspidata/2505:8219-12685(+)